MRPDAIVMRHAASGAPHFLARHLPTPIINAGDGLHEHPTQALLDALTILDHRPSLENMRVAIIGDIVHSRVARSNIHLLSKFGVDIVLCGPAPLTPSDLARLAPGVSITHDIRAAIKGSDVIMMLRVQLERQNETPFPAGDYFRFYGLRLEHLEQALVTQLTGDYLRWKWPVRNDPKPIAAGVERRDRGDRIRKKADVEVA